jgi:hypothetical protein
MEPIKETQVVAILPAPRKRATDGNGCLHFRLPEAVVVPLNGTQAPQPSPTT